MWDLPLGIRIGGMVGFNQVPFILAAKEGSVVEWPGNELIVEAYGKVVVGQDHLLHRFYLSDERTVLQIASDDEGGVLDGETKIFRESEEITPYSEEDWRVWIDEPDCEDGYLIGYETFTHAATEILYHRVWGANGPAQIEPQEFTEEIYGDAQGEPQQVEHQAMLYGRHVPAPPDGQGAGR